MAETILYIIVLIAGFIFAIFLANICKDEIKAWRKRLIIISAVCLVSAVIFISIDFGYKFPAIMTLFFMIIVFLAIIVKNINNSRK